MSSDKLVLHISANHQIVACCSPRRGVWSFEQQEPRSPVAPESGCISLLQYITDQRTSQPYGEIFLTFSWSCPLPLPHLHGRLCHTRCCWFCQLSHTNTLIYYAILFFTFLANSLISFLSNKTINSTRSAHTPTIRQSTHKISQLLGSGNTPASTRIRITLTTQAIRCLKITG